MDWKREADEKLRDYEARKQALQNIPDELARLESAYTHVRGANITGVPAAGGYDSHEDALLSNIVLRQELKYVLKQARKWVKTVDRALSVLDADERLILDLLYMRRAKGNVDRICEKLNIEKTQVYSRKERALRHFTIAYYNITEN